jgi:glycosyltransferase involved in cell wall biosynthesis
MKTLIRITTVPLALKALLPGQPLFMKQNGFNVITISADGPQLKEVIEREQCEHIIVPMTRTVTPLRDIACLLQLIRIFRKYKPDIVHTHTPKAGLLGMLAAKICGVKVRIHTIAGLPVMIATGSKKSILKNTDKLTSWAANHVWPNGRSLMEYMIKEKLVNPKKLEIIMNGSSNGIDLTVFSRENLNQRLLEQIKDKINYQKIENEVKILCVGRMVKDKGVEELIQVFVKLQLKHKIHLILVGPFEMELDPLSRETEEEIMHNPHITHINWSDDVQYYMALANIFVHPSHREGFPNVILQAGAMKLPVVCSDITGNNDIIKDKKTGLLFTAKDADSFYNAVEHAINNRDEMSSFAEVLYKDVNELYERKKMHKAILDAYNRLLSGQAK